MFHGTLGLKSVGGTNGAFEQRKTRYRADGLLVSDSPSRAFRNNVITGKNKAGWRKQRRYSQPKSNMKVK